MSNLRWILCSNATCTDEEKAASTRNYFIRDVQQWEACLFFFFFFCGEKLKNKKKGHKVMVQQNNCFKQQQSNLFLHAAADLKQMFLMSGGEPCSRSQSSGGSQGCSCKCNILGCAQTNLVQRLQALHAGKQGHSGQLVSPPGRTHSLHHSHRPSCWLLTQTCLWKPSRPAAEHCPQETHVSGISPLVQKALLAPGNPRAPNDPQASWEGPCSSLFPKICYRPLSEPQKQSRILDPSQHGCFLRTWLTLPQRSH